MLKLIFLKCIFDFMINTAPPALNSVFQVFDRLKNGFDITKLIFQSCVSLWCCLHDTGATFAPERVHSGSLSWPYICLHDTTTKCHAGASHPGVSSPRLLYRGENFTPVRNRATVSCKRETTTRFGVTSVSRETGTGRACVMFTNLNHTCIYQHEVYLQITRYEMTQLSCKHDTK